MLPSGSLTAGVAALARVLPLGRAHPGVALWSRRGRSGPAQTPGERAGWWRARPAAVPAGAWVPTRRALRDPQAWEASHRPPVPTPRPHPAPLPVPSGPDPSRRVPRDPARALCSAPPGPRARSPAPSRRDTDAAGAMARRADGAGTSSGSGAPSAAAAAASAPAAAPPAGPEVPLRAPPLGPGSGRAGQRCVSPGPTSARRPPGRHGHGRMERPGGVGASAGCRGARPPALSAQLAACTPHEPPSPWGPSSPRASPAQPVALPGGLP